MSSVTSVFDEWTTEIYTGSAQQVVDRLASLTRNTILVLSGTLTVNASIGDNTINVSDASKMLANDKINIKNSTTSEFLTIAKITGNVVTTDEKLVYAYTLAAASSYSVVLVENPVTGLTVLNFWYDTASSVIKVIFRYKTSSTYRTP